MLCLMFLQLKPQEAEVAQVNFSFSLPLYVRMADLQ